MTVFLALIAVLVPASVTLSGFWFKQQAENRLAEEHSQSDRRFAEEHRQSEKRLAQERDQESDRLKLDAAMRAADLFVPSGCTVSNAVRSASGLLAGGRIALQKRK